MAKSKSASPKKAVRQQRPPKPKPCVRCGGPESLVFSIFIFAGVYTDDGRVSGEMPTEKTKRFDIDRRLCEPCLVQLLDTLQALTKPLESPPCPNP